MSAIAAKPRCSVRKLWQKYKCEKRASNMALYTTALTSTNDHLTVSRHYVCT